jgi:hypothetical protein
VSPTNRNHAGVFTRTSQSPAISERRSSSALLPRVPTSRGISGRRRVVRSSSGNPSFHERMNEPITGHAHSGWADHGSPAIQETNSIAQAWMPFVGGSCEPL